MRRRLFVGTLALSFSCVSALVGCGDSATTGPAPEAHDQDKQAGHMNFPAGGPNSPEAKAAKKADAK